MIPSVWNLSLARLSHICIPNTLWNKEAFYCHLSHEDQEVQIHEQT